MDFSNLRADSEMIPISLGGQTTSIPKDIYNYYLQQSQGGMSSADVQNGLRDATTSFYRKYQGNYFNANSDDQAYKTITTINPDQFSSLLKGQTSASAFAPGTITPNNSSVADQANNNALNNHPIDLNNVTPTVASPSSPAVPDPAGAPLTSTLTTNPSTASTAPVIPTVASAGIGSYASPTPDNGASTVSDPNIISKLLKNQQQSTGSLPTIPSLL